MNCYLFIYFIFFFWKGFFKKKYELTNWKKTVYVWTKMQTWHAIFATLSYFFFICSWKYREAVRLPTCIPKLGVGYLTSRNEIWKRLIFSRKSMLNLFCFKEAVFLKFGNTSDIYRFIDIFANIKALKTCFWNFYMKTYV